MSSLTEQVGILSKGFDDCLELILSDPQQKEVEKKGYYNFIVCCQYSFVVTFNILQDWTQYLQL